jgi:hypothetical protein
VTESMEVTAGRATVVTEVMAAPLSGGSKGGAHYL